MKMEAFKPQYKDLHMNRYVIAAIAAVFFVRCPAENTAYAVSGGNGMGVSLQSRHALPVSRGHMHGKLEVSSDLPAPSVNLVIHEDRMAGWNLEINITNMRFAPENASDVHIPGEGHTHLYIDGDKITRIYDRWFHLPPGWLYPGRHEIAVTLSTNDHNDYTYNGEVIAASAVIDVPA